MSYKTLKTSASITRAVPTRHLGIVKGGEQQQLPAYLKIQNNVKTHSVLSLNFPSLFLLLLLLFFGGLILWSNEKQERVKQKAGVDHMNVFDSIKRLMSFCRGRSYGCSVTNKTKREMIKELNICIKIKAPRPQNFVMFLTSNMHMASWVSLLFYFNFF